MTPTPRTDDDEDGALVRWLPAALALADAPRSWIERAAALRLPAAAAADSAPGPGPWLRRVLAVLRGDSAAASALALGLRSGGGAVRHLLYGAEGFDVDLRIDAGDGGHRIAGQLLGPDARGRVALSLDAGDGLPLRRDSAIDACGEFGFDALPDGRCTLALSLDDVRIELPPVDLGAAPEDADRGG